MTTTGLGLVVLIVAAHAVMLAVAYGLMRLVLWAGHALPDLYDTEPTRTDESPTADDYVRATAEACGLDPDEAVAYRRASIKDYPLTSGQEIDSRQPQRSGLAQPAEGPVPDSAARLSGPSGSRREPIADETRGAR